MKWYGRSKFGRAVNAYISGSFTYTSTVNPSITNLYAEYSYDLGWLFRPVMVIMHGWGEDVSHVSSTLRQRMASLGFFVVVVGMRGRNGASGSRDASAKEIYDIVDAISYVRNNFSDLLHPKRNVVVGYSGGGGNALACFAKTPDLFTTIVSHFGPSDYGYNNTYGWYYTNSAFADQITGSIYPGGVYDPDTVPGNYVSRDHTLGIAYQAGLAPSTDSNRIILLHDADDASVSVGHSDRVKTSLDSVGKSSFYNYYRSSSSDTFRYTHGYPDTQPGVLEGEKLWTNKARYAREWYVSPSGTAFVNGWLKTSRFEVWLGPTSGGTPKTDNLGGMMDGALCEYEVLSNGNVQFYVTPQNSNQKVQCIVGGNQTISTVNSGVRGSILVTI